MDFLEFLKTLSDEELKSIVNKRIKMLEDEVIYKDDNNVLGYLYPLNPDNYHLENLGVLTHFNINSMCFCSGFIPVDVKMVYGFSADMNGVISNAGNYYYIDDYSYIMDFCKYIRNKDINDEYEFFDLILKYMKDYFGILQLGVSREEMYRPIHKNRKVVFEPIREHNFSDFKGKGNAQCTEYGIMAQNLLCFFGYDAHLIVGTMKREKDSEGRPHCFNFVSYTGDNLDDINLLMDFSCYIKKYDINFNTIGISPYIMELTSLTEEDACRFVYDDEILSDYGYMLMKMKKNLYKYTFMDKRYYYSEDSYIPISSWREYKSMEEENGVSRVFKKY